MACLSFCVSRACHVSCSALTNRTDQGHRHCPRAQLSSGRPAERICVRTLSGALRTRAAGDQSGSVDSTAAPPKKALKKGDAVVLLEDPPFVKTAEPMPMLRRNDGVIQKGDVGRIIDSRPKDVWAVRLSSGAFLVDGKYLQLLQ